MATGCARPTASRWHCSCLPSTWRCRDPIRSLPGGTRASSQTWKRACTAWLRSTTPWWGATYQVLVPCCTQYQHHITQHKWQSSLPIEHATPLCTALQHCNLERVERQLRSPGAAVQVQTHTIVCGTHRAITSYVADTAAPSVINALFESLEYDLVRDAAVAVALTAALEALTASHDLRQGARYKGLLRLLAHPEPSVRSMVCDAMSMDGPWASRCHNDDPWCICSI